MLIEAMRYHLLPEHRASMITTQSQLRKPVGLVPRLFSIGMLEVLLVSLALATTCFLRQFIVWL